VTSFGLGGGGLISGVRCDDGAPLYASFAHATVDLLDLIEPRTADVGRDAPAGRRACTSVSSARVPPYAITSVVSKGVAP
jgi:hypothetical protein